MIRFCLRDVIYERPGIVEAARPLLTVRVAVAAAVVCHRLLSRTSVNPASALYATFLVCWQKGDAILRMVVLVLFCGLAGGGCTILPIFVQAAAQLG